MIIVTVDGLNWETAEEMYQDVFDEQSMRMIKCNVRQFTNQYGYNATPPGLITLFSGKKTKLLHKNIFRKSFENSSPIDFIDINENPLDMIWHHFDKCKMFEKILGPSPYHNGKIFWHHFDKLKDIGVKFVPCEELCIFSEANKNDYDLFWIHSPIVKGGIFFPGPYEAGRVPSLLEYDVIRKDKNLKREVYRCGVRRYKEVLRYLHDIKPDEIIIVSADHGTLTTLPFNEKQIDEIPVLINRKVDLSDIKYQWDFKKLVLRNINE